MTARKAHPSYPSAVLERHEKGRKAAIPEASRRYRENVTAEF